jgi:hypothetical protein
MMDVRWVAMGFDRDSERLVQEVELDGLTTEIVRRLMRLQSDEDAIGACFDVLPEHVAALNPYAHGRLDLNVADWQIEARPAGQ